MKIRPRFSLRTLFVLVTCFGVWLGWQFRIVEARKECLKRVTKSGGRIISVEAVASSYKDLPQISWVRRMLGDSAIWYIEVSLYEEHDKAEAEIEQIKAIFPEAAGVSQASGRGMGTVFEM